MGKKYIIEMEDIMFHKTGESGTETYLWRVKGFNSLVFDKTGISKLTPYTEPDLDAIRNEAYEKGVQDTKQNWVDAPRSCSYKLGYENALNDAWEAARKISMAEINGHCSWKSMKNIFGYDIPSKIFKNFTASEVIEEIRVYEQAQKEKESEESKKERSVTAEEVMRQYLGTFCKSHRCGECVLNTSDFTCGRGYHFLTNSPVSDEEVRKAYATVLEKMRKE